MQRCYWRSARVAAAGLLVGTALALIPVAVGQAQAYGGAQFPPFGPAGGTPGGMPPGIPYGAPGGMPPAMQYGAPMPGAGGTYGTVQVPAPEHMINRLAQNLGVSADRLREALRQNPGPFGITLSGQGASGDENLQRIAQALGVSADRLMQAMQQTLPAPEGGALYIQAPGAGASGFSSGGAVRIDSPDGWPPPQNGYGPYGPAMYPPPPAPGWPSTWR